MPKKKRKPVFKPYYPDQLSLLPPSLDELIPSNHVVRVVKEVIDKLDVDPIVKKYSGGGRSPFHPKLMLKLLIYGYLSNIYSSRKLEAATQSNIHYMWLAGMQRPDHNTINRFRSEKLKGVLKEVFGQVVKLMLESKLVSLKRVYVDGTKLEANANKYTFVWGKSIQNYKEKIKDQLVELWDYTQTVAAQEMKDNDPTYYEEIDSEKVRRTIQTINTALKDNPNVDKKKKEKLNYAKREWPSKLDKYKAQQEILGPRNSYSKTDHDATFMHMKDDHMRNGQLKAAYNLQISTCDQYILNYDIYQNPTDTLTLPDHLKEFQKLYDNYPEIVVADSGYGSHENYEFLKDIEAEAFVKYSYFHKEEKQKGKGDKKYPFKPDYLHYNKEEDYFICPMGQKMEHKYNTKRKTKSGFEQDISVYEARNCKGCPLRGQCHKSKENRTIGINHALIKLKAKAREKLLSDQGQKHRSQRPADVEAVFGNIKQNKKFTRFNLRGKDKVQIEAGLIAIAHNLAKMAKN